MRKVLMIFVFCTVLCLSACTPRRTASVENNYENDVGAEMSRTIFIYQANHFTIDGDGTITDYIGNYVDIIIPSEINGMPIMAIGARAFRDMGLINIIIPDNITSIGYRAFASNKLTSITIPNSVTSIGVLAFAHNQLTDVYIPDSVREIHWGAFDDNQLTSVTISNGVTTIFYEAFSNNQLTSITIPYSITRIFGGAFSGNQITSVTIGENVEFIDYFYHIGLMPIFDNNFEYFYNENGRRAGTYIFNNGQWSIDIGF